MRIRVGLFAVCLLAATGCSAEAEPDPLPPVATASPTPAPVVIPDEAAAETPEGAAAFAEYYLDVIGQAFASADPTTLDALSADGCEGCDALIQSVESLKVDSQRREGGQYVVLSAAAPPVESGDVTVEISYKRTAARIVDKTGRALRSAEAVPPTNAQMRLVRRGEGWVVQGYRTLPS